MVSPMVRRSVPPFSSPDVAAAYQCRSEAGTAVWVCVSGRARGRRRRARRGRNVIGLAGLGLDRQDLAKTAPVSRLATERRSEEREGALIRRLRPMTSTQRQDVHVVVLDALVGRIGVVADRGH